MLHYSFESLKAHSTAVAKILDDAFKVNSYVNSFPHIFSENSSALIACARNEQGALVGVCSVDTEQWKEPHSLRGACIGSVAVAPSAQGQGVGTALLNWVIQELRVGGCHDFIYLFSAENRFYDRLGFVAVGKERLFAFDGGFKSPSGIENVHLTELRRTTELNACELRKLWCSLEQMRLSGESHAGWLKFVQVCRIPDLWVSWISQNHSDRIVAGGFVGKGIDFQGVMHNPFACSSAALNDFLNVFSKHHKELSKSLLLAPGLWSGEFTSSWNMRAEQNLSYVLPLTAAAQSCMRAFKQGTLYPRSLFSS
jgi:predicted N-acetyltransferase YhbS